jgi:non-specific serine/threonine protein kinase
MTSQTLSHYRVLEKLGAGGMGVVYKAQDLKLDRLVALKFLPPLLSADPQQKQHLIQEAKAAPSITRTSGGPDIDETGDGQMFIVMAYYDGETLARRIERGVSHRKPSTSRFRFRRRSGGHEHGIVHRDNKPGNVLLTPDGVVKVIDFGLARAADVTVTLEGTTQGTTLYVSPSRCGEQIDQRTDIWAAGVVLYEILKARTASRATRRWW